MFSYLEKPFSHLKMNEIGSFINISRIMTWIHQYLLISEVVFTSPFKKNLQTLHDWISHKCRTINYQTILLISFNVKKCFILVIVNSIIMKSENLSFLIYSYFTCLWEHTYTKCLEKKFQSCISQTNYL